MSESSKPSSPWWEFFFPGLLFLPGSVFAWWYLSELERQPGQQQLRLPAAAVLLYNWGGKWAIVLFVLGVGALFTGIGTYKLITRAKGAIHHLDATRPSDLGAAPLAARRFRLSQNQMGPQRSWN